MATAKALLDFMKKNDVKHIDLRMTDLRGTLHHMTYNVAALNEDALKNGILFDGSSIAGWREINESDMKLIPDPSTAVIDPFYTEPTLAVYCDIADPDGKPYGRCPRTIARRAEKFLASGGVGDTAYFGPEAEFFLFDDVKFSVRPHSSFFEVDSREAPRNSSREYESGNQGHRPRVKGGYFPVNPVDSAQDLRTEMLQMMAQVGLKVEKHHHEVAAAQHELGIVYDTLLKCADNMQMYKYIVRNVAHAYGKTATFMPKPVQGDNGSGMHVHQSLWKSGKPLFAGKAYAGLSPLALHYIGGIIKHAKALNAITNPTTNSYKRLVPGFEAPVLLAYACGNRSAACRVPHTLPPASKRVEVRFPDPCANPYLAFAAMLMAGLDGIKNKIDPGAAMEENLYALPPKAQAKIPTVCGSLEEAMRALEKDHDFLLKGGVFTADALEAYLGLKKDEWDAYRTAPHPIEYDLYYSA